MLVIEIRIQFCSGEANIILYLVQYGISNTSILQNNILLSWKLVSFPYKKYYLNFVQCKSREQERCFLKFILSSGLKKHLYQIIKRNLPFPFLFQGGIYMLCFFTIFNILCFYCRLTVIPIEGQVILRILRHPDPHLQLQQPRGG